MKVIDQELFNTTIGASFTSNPIDLQQTNDLSLQIVVTTSANTGQFSVEVSNDATNWDAVTFDTAIAALANANKTISISMTDVPFRWARVKFVIGTGTGGTAVCKLFGKEV